MIFALAFSTKRGWPWTDFDQTWYGARALFAGQDPYSVLGPDRTFELPWPLYYPATALFAVAPLAAMPLPVARVLFVAASSAVLAYALTRDGWHRLLVLAHAAFPAAVAAAQWTPILTAAFLVPSLGWLAAVKPNIGIALLAAAKTRRQIFAIVGGGTILTLVSLAVDPHWPLRWFELLRAAPHFRPLLTIVPGPLILLAILRWRRAEARLLLALACVPQTTLLYESLPLALIARTRRESLGLAVFSVLGLVGQQWAIQHTGAGFTANTLATGRVVVVCCYLPALVLLLRRTSNGAAPARLEPGPSSRPSRWLRSTLTYHSEV